MVVVTDMNVSKFRSMVLVASVHWSKIKKMSAPSILVIDVDPAVVSSADIVKGY